MGKAAAQLGTSLAALEPAEVHQWLISLTNGIEFRHPLIRSAIYSNASSARRRSIHLALASALDVRTNRERWAMHKALAAIGPEEEVAAALEESATEARLVVGDTCRDGTLDPLRTFTRPPRSVSGRLLAAAHAAHLAGNASDAFVLFQSAWMVTPTISIWRRHRHSQDLFGDPYLGRRISYPALLLHAGLSRRLHPARRSLEPGGSPASLCSILSVYQSAAGITGRGNRERC